MRLSTELWRLSFILPDKFYRAVRRGPQVPCLHGCLLVVHGAGLVTCEGWPREIVLEQSRRWLSLPERFREQIAATLLRWPGEPRTELWRFTLGRIVEMVRVDQLGLPGIGDSDFAEARRAAANN